MKKTLSILLILFMLCFCSTKVLATNINLNSQQNPAETSISENATMLPSSKASIELVENTVCDMNLSDIGKFEKKITNFDAEKKEATLTLTVTNQKEPQVTQKPAEIFLVLDNSSSMQEAYDGKSKSQYVIEAANKFVNSLFQNQADYKVGVVSFSNSESKNADGLYDKLGTMDDAKLNLALSNSKDTVISAINNYSTSIGGFTNIEAGLALAQNSFSDNEETQKYIILLSDGVPNLSLDTANTLKYSGANAQNTKSRIQSIANSGIGLFSVLTEKPRANLPNPQAPMVESENRRMTYSELATEIFGTTENPTAGKFFYIDYPELETTINDKIYNDIVVIVDNKLKNIVIKDYFPQEIIDNFNFEYVASPNIGEVSPTINTEDNSITWNIEVLNEGEIATLSYKLILKDTFNKEIIDKILPTNEKVDITYENDGKKEDITSNKSPKLKLTYEEEPAPEPEPKPEPKPDNTVANTVIPQTGNYPHLLIVLGIVIIFFTISRMIVLKNNRLQ